MKKNARRDTPSLLTYLSSQHSNNSVDLGYAKGFRGYRLRIHYNQQNSYVSSFDGQAKRGSLAFLKESLTVKKIDISPTRKCEMPMILKPKVEKQVALESISSSQDICKFRNDSLPNDSLREKSEEEAKRKCTSQQPTPKTYAERRKEAAFLGKNIVTNNIQKAHKPLAKISLKEALRFSEWVAKARPELDKMWRKILNRSNGVDFAVQNTCQYKYYIGKGNNSRLIRRLMTSRSWWVDTNNIEEANFAWTQWKDKKLLSAFDCAKSNNFIKQETIMAPSICPVNLRLEKNHYRSVDIDDLGFQCIRNSPSYVTIEAKSLDALTLKMHNKIEFNQHLTNKKGLYQSLKNYCEALNLDLFDFVPLTFHVTLGEKDPEFARFVETFNNNVDIDKKKKSGNVWIVKPGENSNRGQGITVCSSIEEIRSIVNDISPTKNNQNRTYIIQKYIEKPFLVHKRKFDFRCYALVTSFNGVIQGYFYSDGYLRTTSTEYNIKDVSNNFIHLTNDAIQKHCDEYGKYEDGNKLSYKDFQRYLDTHSSDKKINFILDILPKIKGLAKDSIMAAYMKLDPNRRLHCMEILGYDFMLDSNLKPWLIEVNTNPCLELSSSYLSFLIPTMVENAFRIALDSMFPPPSGKFSPSSFIENKFELVFHQETDGRDLMERLGGTVPGSDDQILSEKEELFSEDEEPDL
ncbi:hypothetical protein SteCoe_35572 [Stentor coeruleus]|uniref:Tubulin-tyrosine ligase family protein n=1 Tax=Stentor coeruleus TaxID=5963 RepID=A0A1R2ASC0_9CILI|nr:hypothetical protein SteCoe_35572 [Stentor coeruleus]